MLVGVDGHPSMGLLFLIKHTPITLNKPAAKNEEGTHYGPKEGPCVGTTSQVGLYKAAVSTGDGLSCACHRQCAAKGSSTVQHSPASPRQAPPHAAAAVQGLLASCLLTELARTPIVSSSMPSGCGVCAAPCAPPVNRAAHCVHTSFALVIYLHKAANRAVGMLAHAALVM